jgi:hypothetical protein
MDIFSSRVTFDVSGITVLNGSSNKCFQCPLFRTNKIDTMCVLS